MFSAAARELALFLAATAFFFPLLDGMVAVKADYDSV